MSRFFLKIPSSFWHPLLCRGKLWGLRAAEERNREDPHHSSESFFASIDCIRARFLHFSHNAVTKQQCLRTNNAWSSAKTTKSRSRTRRDSCTRLPTECDYKKDWKEKDDKTAKEAEKHAEECSKLPMDCQLIAKLLENNDKLFSDAKAEDVETVFIHRRHGRERFELETERKKALDMIAEKRWRARRRE